MNYIKILFFLFYAAGTICLYYAAGADMEQEKIDHCKAAGWKLIIEKLNVKNDKERMNLESTLSVYCQSDLNHEKRQYGLKD